MPEAAKELEILKLTSTLAKDIFIAGRSLDSADNLNELTTFVDNSVTIALLIVGSVQSKIDAEKTKKVNREAY